MERHYGPGPCLLHQSINVKDVAVAVNSPFERAGVS